MKIKIIRKYNSWYKFALVGRNGKTVMESHYYKKRYDCLRTAKATASNLYAMTGFKAFVTMLRVVDENGRIEQ